MTVSEALKRVEAFELLTVRQVAVLLQYHPMTVYEKARLGQLPGVERFGRALRFRKVAILPLVRVRAQVVIDRNLDRSFTRH